MVFFFLIKDETGRTIPKFGAWDVNNPASADGFTVIFSKARDEKKGPVNVDASTRSNSDMKDSNNNKATEKINPYHRRTNSASVYIYFLSSISFLSITLLISMKMKKKKRSSSDLWLVTCKLLLFIDLFLQKKWFCCVSPSPTQP